MRVCLTDGTARIILPPQVAARIQTIVSRVATNPDLKKAALSTQLPRCRPSLSKLKFLEIKNFDRALLLVRNLSGVFDFPNAS